jgi:thiol-disulfide isomerase/thioredoxin
MMIVNKSIIFVLLLFCGAALGQSQDNKSQTLDINKSAQLYSLDNSLEILEITNGNIIFIFYADWCGPCQQMHIDTINPILERVRRQYIVCLVNIDKYKEHPFIKYAKSRN